MLRGLGGDEHRLGHLEELREKSDQSPVPPMT